MSLRKYIDPFETLTSLQSDVEKIFNQNLLQAKSGKDQSSLARSAWVPAIDIHEDNEAFYFDAELPGLKEDQIDVSVENSILTIKGERKQENEKKDKNFYRLEREYGSFLRSFTLPEVADTEKVNAEFKNGVLHLKIAKKEAVKPKQIKVKAV